MSLPARPSAGRGRARVRHCAIVAGGRAFSSLREREGARARHIMGEGKREGQRETGTETDRKAGRQAGRKEGRRR